MDESIEQKLNGINLENQIPIFLTQDALKLLRVNGNATGLEWSNETVATGYISERGDGSTNTIDDFVGYIFKNELKTGLFNYQSGINNILTLKINNSNILECLQNQINANQNLFFSSDNTLTSQRINFGSTFCGISGNNNVINNEIAFKTDNNTRLIIDTNNGILAKTQIKFDVGYSLLQPHISRNGSISVGISFDSTTGIINMTASGTTIIAEFAYNKIDLKEPVIFRNPNCYPDLRIIIDGSYTVPANLTGNSIYYLKRGLVTNSDITFAQPTAGYNPRYEIITDGNANSSTFLCRLSTTSNDVLLMNAASRTLISPVSNYTLTLNAHYIMQFVDADSRWLMTRVA